MNDAAKVLAYSAAAAGFSVAAHRSARALGLPGMAVGLLGALFLALAARA